MIHSTKIDPTAFKSHPQLTNFDYSTIQIKQAFVHHVEGPCPITSYADVWGIAEKFEPPLVSMSGGSDFIGSVCAAFTQHGFRNKEVAVMKLALEMITPDRWVSSDL